MRAKWSRPGIEDAERLPTRYMPSADTDLEEALPIAPKRATQSHSWSMTHHLAQRCDEPLRRQFERFKPPNQL